MVLAKFLKEFLQRCDKVEKQLSLKFKKLTIAWTLVLY